MAPEDLTTLVLFYGDYPALARRFLERWSSHSPGMPLRVGMNACSPATHALVEDAASSIPNLQCWRVEENLGKTVMMRRMLYESPITTPWVAWFDDDSFPFRSDWLLCLEVAQAAQPNAVIFGVPASIEVGERIRRFVEQSPWYRGLPLQPPIDARCSARLDFILGGFWVIRREWLERLEWPDRRLRHFGDDYLLGEAIRQQGGVLGAFASGVRVDTAPRRAPAGQWTDEAAWLA